MTGVDISEAAVRKASLKARRKKLKIQFLQDNVLHSRLEGKFDFILDRGCFHTFPPEKRRDYIRTVIGLIRKGGILFLKCFSDLEPGKEGPYRFKPEEIRKLFARTFTIQSITRSSFQGTLDHSPQALFCILEK